MAAATSLYPGITDFLSSDGTLHYHDLKRVQDSGVQYLHGLTNRREPTRAMLVGTGGHHIVLGKRPDSKVAFFDGPKRVGKAWDDFAAKYDGYDILTKPEQEEAEACATAVLTDPVAHDFLEGGEYELPLKWMDGDIPCSTSGVDILQRHRQRFGDLKFLNTTEIEKLQRHTFNLQYHCQLAWVRRGLIANGIDVSQGSFLLCADVHPPHEVVVLEMSEDLQDLAERTLSLWMERLNVYIKARQFPGRAQSAVVWTVPTWMQKDEDSDEA